MATVFTQAHLPTPIGPASVGFFMGHPLSDQRLSVEKVAEILRLVGPPGVQQAQGKHRNECRNAPRRLYSGRLAILQLSAPFIRQEFMAKL
jgi:hypothetical protein